MKWSFATVGVILLGLVGVSIILLFQQITTNNENDYYLLKEVTEAAMIDAIDIPYYRETGDLKISREKFVENFARRFSESTLFVTNEYTIKSYDIMETPPKVSIIIDTGLGDYTVGGNIDSYGIANRLDAILEYTGKYTNVSSGNSYYNNPYVSKTLEKEYYAILSKSNGSSNFDVTYSLKVPSELVAPNIKNISVSGAQFINDYVDTQGELGMALLKNELSYNNVTSDYMQSISEFSFNVSNISTEIYNCGFSTSKYTCGNDDSYYVSLNGITGDTSKNKVVFRYKVIWSYDEYEFSN